LRQFDSASNPYHTLACCLSAGLDGLTRHTDPGDPFTGNAQSRTDLPRSERIPLTPAEAAEAFQGDALMKHVFPQRLYDALLALREDEWRRYWNQISQWEVEFYLMRWS
jgi:glutamine synthetase